MPRRLIENARGLVLAALLMCLVVPSTDVVASAPAPKSASKQGPSKPGSSKPTTSQPDVRSQAVLVFDRSTGAVLYSRRADLVAPIASITKLMTALVVVDGKLPLDELIEITKEDRRRSQGSPSRLAVGAKLTRGDLMRLALMSSENRAAHALGRSYPGGEEGFVKAMNARAKALGMTSTRFVDPSGLSSSNVSSPKDLVKLVQAASRSPTIRSYSTTPHYTVKVGNSLLEYRNTNLLVNKPDWDIAVQKTGYLSEAGQCLVMQATIQDRPVVMVLLNSFGKYTRVADARRIRQWMESRPVTSVARATASR